MSNLPIVLFLSKPHIFSIRQAPAIVLLQYKHDEFCHEAAEKASLANPRPTNERYIEFGGGRKCSQIFTGEWTMRFACCSTYCSSVLFLVAYPDPDGSLFSSVAGTRSVFRTWIRIQMFRIHNNFGKNTKENNIYNILEYFSTLFYQCIRQFLQTLFVNSEPRYVHMFIPC
jgi:hypothetical protein